MNVPVRLVGTEQLSYFAYYAIKSGLSKERFAEKRKCFACGWYLICVWQALKLSSCIFVCNI